MPKRQIETYEWLDMLSRMIRAAGRRVGHADERELAKLVDLQREFDTAVQVAVDGQIAAGRSWSYVGNVLGISKQAAFKRFGRPPALRRLNGPLKSEVDFFAMLVN